MKRTNHSKTTVIGLFMLSLAAFLYLNTRPNTYSSPTQHQHATPTLLDSTKVSKQQKIKQAISDNPAIQAILFIEETNELIGFRMSR